MMKNIICIFLPLVLFVLTQCNPASPTTELNGTIDDVQIDVGYSSPRVKGRERKIFGELVPYGEVWRAGANAATSVSFNKPVLIEGEPLKAGVYSLFMIPQQNGPWQIIFNKATGFSGMDYIEYQDQDVLKVAVEPQTIESIQEELLYHISDSYLKLDWEHISVPIKIEAVK